MATAEVVEVDYFEYVRKGLQGKQGAELVRIASDAGVSPRTLEYIAKEGRDSRYSTVLNVYRVLKDEAEPKPKKKRAR